jgi:beta-1,4-mannosyltransferase
MRRAERTGITVIQPPVPGSIPYIRLLVKHLSRMEGLTVLHDTGPGSFRGADVWHLHWPEQVLKGRGPVTAFVGCLGYLLRVRYARLWGTRIVWTLHNLRSHDTPRPGLDRWFRGRLCELLDGWITMSRAVQAEAEEAYPALKTRPVFHIPHGHWRSVYPNEVTRAEARGRLGIAPEARVVLFFGALRPYKNVLHLQRTFRALPDPLARLVVAGPCRSDELKAEVLKLVREDERTRAWPIFIPDEEVQWYFRAADLVVLPFKAIANSGSALLPLSFGVPLLVPNLGGMQELSRYAGDEWVRTFDGELSPEVLREALLWATETPRDEPPLLEELDWQKIAVLTVRCYRALLEDGHGTAPGKAGAEAYRDAALVRSDVGRQPAVVG